MKLKKRIAKLSGIEVDQLVCEWCGNDKFEVDVNKAQISLHCTVCDYGIGFVGWTGMLETVGTVKMGKAKTPEPSGSLLNPKWCVIHGAGTIYRLSIFKFGGEDHEFLRDYAGFGEGRKYIGAIVWSNRPKFIYDNPGGYPPDSLRKAGLAIGDFICSVLEVGWGTILNQFDEIPDGSTIKVEPNERATSTKELAETSKVEIVEGWER